MSPESTSPFYCRASPLPKQQRRPDLAEMVERGTAPDDELEAVDLVAGFFEDLDGRLAHLNLGIVELRDEQPDGPVRVAGPVLVRTRMVARLRIVNSVRAQEIRRKDAYFLTASVRTLSPAGRED